jgi:hypothetical protein
MMNCRFENECHNNPECLYLFIYGLFYHVSCRKLPGKAEEIHEKSVDSLSWPQFQQSYSRALQTEAIGWILMILKTFR